MKRILIISLLLAGCGSDQNDNHGLGFQTDETSSVTGISVRYANSDSLTIKEIDALYYATAACMGVIQSDGKPPMPPRMILFVPPPVNRDEPGNIGREWNDGTIASDSTLPKGIYGYGAWRNVAHEFVHWLLFVTKGDADSEHKSDFFKTCVGHYTGTL